MDEERVTSLRVLEDHLGYHFTDLRWLDKALTHKSFVHQGNTISVDPSTKVANEVLEFLGDAVLNLAVSHLLLHEFPDAHEGTLSQKRAHLVKKASLSFISKQLQLEHHLLLGKGELLNGGRKKSSILANTYEAVIGAIYMDAGFDGTLEIVRHHLRPYFQSGMALLDFNDYKGLLQSHAQRTFGLSPRYHLVEEHGPDHQKRFQISVAIGGEVWGVGWGTSKKEAEQEAAKKALEEMDVP
jgi:ribonuclease-3